MVSMRSALSVLMFLPLAACAGAPRPDAAPLDGYLGSARARALADALPAPPAAGSPQDLADAAAVRAAQVRPGSARWLLAQADAELDPAAALAMFDCPLGFDLRGEVGGPPPQALARVFARERVDAGDAWTAAKARFAFRAKPNAVLGVDPCTEQPARAQPVSAYPAAHAVMAQVWSRTLAELAPDRAQALAAKAREIGQSRIVCALQYPSDVTAGEALGRRLFEAVRTAPGFETDLAAARDELVAARAAARLDPACTALDEAARAPS